MYYDNLPIYKASMNFCVYIEMIAKTFDKYSKYTMSVELEYIIVKKSEQCKMLIQLSKELKVFNIVRAYHQMVYSHIVKIRYFFSNNAWSVDFSNSNTNNNNKTISYSVRCVRGGE